MEAIIKSLGPQEKKLQGGEPKKRRDESIEYFRLMESAWHKNNPNGAGSNNPKFTERAYKANAAKRNQSTAKTPA